MKRKRFINTFSLGTLGLTTLSGLDTSALTASATLTKITILHTNDVHSHIDTFGPDEGEHANKGGVARRATLIERIRKENPNTLLVDAGDIFQGTPYFNYYGGALELKLMSLLNYDVATLGNHDFDNGLEGLCKQLPHANFSFVSANYDFSKTVMDTYIKPYKIFEKAGVRIGFFGLGVALKGLVSKNLYGETKYLDPIEMAQDMSRILKHNENCDVVICLSHLGYAYHSNQISDLKLAKRTKDIDLIIGGHTHTFLQEPTLVKNKVNKNVIVNQVGCYGLFLGQIDFYFKHSKVLKITGGKVPV